MLYMYLNENYEPCFFYQNYYIIDRFNMCISKSLDIHILNLSMICFLTIIVIVYTYNIIDIKICVCIDIVSNKFTLYCYSLKIIAF